MFVCVSVHAYVCMRSCLCVFAFVPIGQGSNLTGTIPNNYSTWGNLNLFVAATANLGYVLLYTPAPCRAFRCWLGMLAWCAGLVC